MDYHFEENTNNQSHSQLKNWSFIFHVWSCGISAGLDFLNGDTFSLQFTNNISVKKETDVNSLRPSDAIWRQWSWTTLAQVMACCLTAPSHYLNQCWLIIRGVLWHTSESSFAGIAQGIDSEYEFEKDILKNIFKSPRGQWVKKHTHARLLGLLRCLSKQLHEHLWTQPICRGCPWGSISIWN